MNLFDSDHLNQVTKLSRPKQLQQHQQCKYRSNCIQKIKHLTTIIDNNASHSQGVIQHFGTFFDSFSILKANQDYFHKTNLLQRKLVHFI